MILYKKTAITVKKFLLAIHTLVCIGVLDESVPKRK